MAFYNKYQHVRPSEPTHHVISCLATLHQAMTNMAADYVRLVVHFVEILASEDYL